MAERVTEQKLEIPISETGASIQIQAVPFGGRCAIIDASAEGVANGVTRFGLITQAILDSAKWRVVGEILDEDGDPITDVRKQKERACELITFEDMQGLCLLMLRYLKMIPGNLRLPGEEGEQEEDSLPEIGTE